MSDDAEVVDVRQPAGVAGLLKSRPTNDVVIVGAGFSRSISDLMPLTDELGTRAVVAAGIGDAPSFADGRFEAWLSRLAEPQPDLTQAQNTENLAKFQRLVGAIHEVVREVQASVLAEGLPEWLLPFAAALHARRVTVISFNYDLLVEHAVEALGLVDVERPVGEREVQWVDLIGDVPPYPPQPPRFAGSTKPTLRLLKLHGSLNWYWVPGDSSGATLNHWELEEDEDGRRRYLPGREPFIVPPAAVKSAFFRNPIMSETWRRAADALRQAERIFLVGYSLPLTDLVSVGMISDALRDRDVRIEVVNPAPDPVVESVRRATGRTASVCESVESFASAFVESSSRELAQNLVENGSDVPSDALLFVGWNLDLMGPALSATRVGDDVEIAVADVARPQPTALRDGDQGGAITMRELTRVVRSGDTITAVLANGSRTRLIGIDRFRTEVGASTRWQLLVPANRPVALGVQSWLELQRLDRA